MLAKKDSRRVSYTLRSDIADALEAYSKETGIPKTRVIEKLIEKNLPKTNKNRNVEKEE